MQISLCLQNLVWGQHHDSLRSMSVNISFIVHGNHSHVGCSHFGRIPGYADGGDDIAEAAGGITVMSYSSQADGLKGREVPDLFSSSCGERHPEQGLWACGIYLFGSGLGPLELRCVGRPREDSRKRDWGVHRPGKLLPGAVVGVRGDPTFSRARKRKPEKSLI